MSRLSCLIFPGYAVVPHVAQDQLDSASVPVPFAGRHKASDSTSYQKAANCHDGGKIAGAGKIPRITGYNCGLVGA